MEVYDKLRIYREKKGLSQQDVAVEMNVTRQTVSSWENGKSMPDLNRVVLLGALYQVSLDELLGNGQNAQVVPVADVEKTEEKVEAGKEETEEKERKNLEWNSCILLLVLLAISALIPPLGIMFPMVVLHEHGKNEQLKASMKILCVLCIVVSIYNVVVGLNSWFDFFYYSNVQISD